MTLGQCPYFVAAWLCFPRLIVHAGVARTDASQAAKAGQERQRPMLDPTILSFSQLNGVFAFLSMYIIIVYIHIYNNIYIHIIIIYIYNIIYIHIIVIYMYIYIYVYIYTYIYVVGPQAAQTQRPEREFGYNP